MDKLYLQLIRLKREKYAAEHANASNYIGKVSFDKLGY
jgi:hypothetical protein